MKQSKANVQLVNLMGTTILVLCLVPIIDGLRDRRFCDVDALCGSNEDESRFYSDKRVDRLDQDQEQRLLLFNRVERRDASQLDRLGLDRAYERRMETRDERFGERFETGKQFVDRRETENERIRDRRLFDSRGERMNERFEESRRINAERSRSGDDREERQEQNDRRRERDIRDERRTRLYDDSERRERRETREPEERRERVDRTNDRAQNNERLAGETTNDNQRETTEQVESSRARQGMPKVEERRVREHSRNEEHREERSAVQAFDARLNNQENVRADKREHLIADRRLPASSEEDTHLERLERRNQENKNRDDIHRYDRNSIPSDGYVDNDIPSKDNNSMPFLWNIVQGALIAFIGVQLMKKSELNGDWKPSKFSQLIKLQDMNDFGN